LTFTAQCDSLGETQARSGKDVTNVSLVDVRHLDGEPWDVAQIAGRQVSDCFALLDEALEGLFWAARGAWMSQEHYREGEMPDGIDFPLSPLGVRLSDAHDSAAAAQKAANAVALAASYDPRSV
jgi:hypothetical protein